MCTVELQQYLGKRGWGGERCGEICSRKTILDIEMKGVGTVAAGQFAQNGSKCDGPDVQHEHCVLSRYRHGDGHKGQLI